MLHQLHDTATSGHLGDVCATRKGPHKAIRAPMAQHNVGAPMERVAVDVLGPLLESDQGNKYLLIIADYFTKWTEAFSIHDQEAITVAEILVKEVVSRYVVPLVLHSDQGRNFESNVFAEMCRLLGIQKTRTTALHPQPDLGSSASEVCQRAPERLGPSSTATNDGLPYFSP